MLSKIIRNIALDPRVKDCNLDRDSVDLLRVHADVIKNKKIIRHVFEEFYELCKNLDEIHLNGSGKIVEIGSGVSFIKEMNPSIVTSDIKDYDGVDIILDAQNMHFGNSQIHAFYGINCFHHLPNPKIFFSEVARTLKPGGGVVLIEPYYGLLSNIIYKKVHEDEFYDKNQLSWETGQDSGQYMTGANQALSYIVFERDRKIFEDLFPELEIVHSAVINNYIRYLVSGGVNFRQLLPDSAESWLSIIEKILAPFNRIFGLHQVIVLKRRR
jgi:SAM-dependent methyltransferase